MLPTPSNFCCVADILHTRYSSSTQTPRRCLSMEERGLNASHPGPGDFYPVYRSRRSLLLDWFQPFFGAALADQPMVNFVSHTRQLEFIPNCITLDTKVRRTISVTRALVKFVKPPGASSERVSRRARSTDHVVAGSGRALNVSPLTEQFFVFDAVRTSGDKCNLHKLHTTSDSHSFCDDLIHPPNSRTIAIWWTFAAARRLRGTKHPEMS